MLYEPCASSRGKPAGVIRDELCSFHFLDLLPDVSSQYSHVMNAITRFLLALFRHRFRCGSFHVLILPVSGLN